MKRFGASLVVASLACVLAACVGCSSIGAPFAASSSVSAAPASASSEVFAPASSSDPPASASGILADGTYSIAVTLAGGMGKATVESPTELAVEGGSMTARIVWSSPNYDQMVVDGVQYLPVNTSGNSAFEIPVAALDENLPVQAETTAMSSPHMIDYSLRFDSDSLQ